jgi:hypothetical protein
VPDQQQRQKLFAAVAYDCQMNQQPDEARELFLAAGKPLPALLIILQQLTGAIHSQRGECCASCGDRQLFSSTACLGVREGLCSMQLLERS